MKAAALMAAAIAAGVRVKVNGGGLLLSAPEQPDEGLLERIRCEKAEIAEYLHGFAAWTNKDWQALFDERAGIMEFDGGLTRAEAEARASEEVANFRAAAEGRDA